MSIVNEFQGEEKTIFNLLNELLKIIKSGDVEGYKKMVDKNLTCIEPETGGNLVRGLPFHIFLLEKTIRNDFHFEIVNPVIKIVGDMCYISYTLSNIIMDDTKPKFSQFQETRIFEKMENEWKMIHFHRSG